MICFHCGKEIAKGSQFCPYCGKATAINTEPVPLVHTEDKPSNVGTVAVSLMQEEVPETNGSSIGREAEVSNFYQFETVVKKNALYYTNEFKKVARGQKAKFNWAAFFFGTFLSIYRKCYKLFVRYYLLPLCISFTGSIITVYGAMNFFQKAIVGGGAISLVATIWGVVNAIRLGRNFNAEYYQHCLSVLAEGDSKKYGVAIGPVVLFTFTIVLISALINLPWAVSDNNPVNWGGAPTLGLAKSWGLMDSEEEPTGTFNLEPSPGYEEQDSSQSDATPPIAPSVVLNNGIFGTNPTVELTVNGDYISYSVYMEFGGGQIAGLEGTAPLSNEISFMGNDGWDNIVEGKIYYIDDNTIAVESQTIEEAEYGLGYSLDIEYTQLKRQEERLAFYPESAYDGMPTFSLTKFINIDTSAFCEAYEGSRVRIYGLSFFDGTYDTNRRTLVDDAKTVVLMDMTIDDVPEGFGSDVVVEGNVVGTIDYGDFYALCLDDTEVNIWLTDYWVDGDYATSHG